MSTATSDDTPSPIGPGLARTLVAVTSAAVLVLEILAGRLLAPYIGVSLETFTGIIGVVLAGIALGAWAGGELADARDPRTLIGPAMISGGVLSWLALPIIRALGGQFGSGATAIVLLTTAAFFLPATVLSAVGPLVAKVRLQSLEDTGAVVGGLSAAGTLGALAGTFLTGFVLVQALPTRPIVLLVGAILVVSGLVTHWHLVRSKPTGPAAIGVVAALALSGAVTTPCQFETGYACVNIVNDADRSSGRSLILDQTRHAYVDLEDPAHLEIRYIRLLAATIEAAHGSRAPIETLHVGGGGFSLPNYLQHTRPGSTDVVLEIDADLVDIAERELGLETSDALVVIEGDARLAMNDFTTGSFDVVVGDAFSSFTVPWHLTTTEFVAEVDRVLSDDGLYVINVIDGGDNLFARAELATMTSVFDHVGVIVPADGLTAQGRRNQILIGSRQPIPRIEVDSDDGRVLSAAELDAYLAAAEPLRDDYAPVDQLLGN